MADDDDKSQKEQTPADAEARASTRRSRGGASAVDEAPFQRPQPTTRILTRSERETLRARLQKKFH
jgi:hypothetical protein